MPAIAPEDLQPGDLAACYGADRISRGITWATANPLAPAGLRLGPSHVAVIVPQLQGGPVWCESTTLCERPCLLRRKPVSGCQAHRPPERIADYLSAGGRVEIWRLSRIDRLRQPEIEILREIVLHDFVGNGLGYDIGGALLSGRRLRTLPRLLCADLESLFCSELVAAVLMRLNRLNRANPSWYNPSRLLRQLFREGTYQLAGHAVLHQEQVATIRMWPIQGERWAG